MIRPPPLPSKTRLPPHLRWQMRIWINVLLVDTECSVDGCMAIMPAGDAVYALADPGALHVSRIVCPVHGVEEVERQKLDVRLALHKVHQEGELENSLRAEASVEQTGPVDLG